MPRRTHIHRISGRRGQTSIDFIIGMTIFLFAIGFVFGFVPSIFEPFVGETASNMIVGDRTASTLTDDIIGDPQTPGVLDVTCTAALFADDLDDEDIPDDCRFDQREDLNRALGVDDERGLNVTIETVDDGDTEVLERSDVEIAGDTYDVRYARGPSDPAGSDTIETRRVVEMGDEQYRLYVRVW